MKSTRKLRLRLRLIEGALALLLAVGTTAAVSTHQLLLDAANQPVGDLSLTSPHVVGTLDPARLPASVPVLNAGDNLVLDGGNGSLLANWVFFDTLYTRASLRIADGDGNLSAANLTASGATSLDDGFIGTDGAGGLNVGTLLAVAGRLVVDSDGVLYAAGYTVADGAGNLFAGGNQVANGNGELLTANGGALIGDALGFLHTGSQNYHAGGATPTGYLLIKDGTGTLYRGPASAAP